VCRRSVASWAAWVVAHSSQRYGARSVEPFLDPIKPSRFLVLPYAPRAARIPR
jgi:hypothetical protein